MSFASIYWFLSSVVSRSPRCLLFRIVPGFYQGRWALALLGLVTVVVVALASRIMGVKCFTMILEIS